MAYIKIMFHESEFFLDIASKLIDNPEISNDHSPRSADEKIKITGTYEKDSSCGITFRFQRSGGTLHIACYSAGGNRFSSRNSEPSETTVPMDEYKYDQLEWEEAVEEAMLFLYKKTTISFIPIICK